MQQERPSQCRSASSGRSTTSFSSRRLGTRCIALDDRTLGRRYRLATDRVSTMQHGMVVFTLVAQEQPQRRLVFGDESKDNAAGRDGHRRDEVQGHWRRRDILAKEAYSLSSPRSARHKMVSLSDHLSAHEEAGKSGHDSMPPLLTCRAVAFGPWNLEG